MIYGGEFPQRGSTHIVREFELYAGSVRFRGAVYPPNAQKPLASWHSLSHRTRQHKTGVPASYVHRPKSRMRIALAVWCNTQKHILQGGISCITGKFRYLMIRGISAYIPRTKNLGNMRLGSLPPPRWYRWYKSKQVLSAAR